MGSIIFASKYQFLRLFKYKILFLFFLSFHSCARVSDSDLAQLSPQIPLNVSEENALSQEFFEEGGWPTDRWWEMFEDDQLSLLIEMAIQESPLIQQALAKVAAAESTARLERGALFPNLSAGYEEQWQYFSKHGFVRSFYPTPPTVAIPATVNQIDLTLNFNYEIDFFGRNRNLFKAALGRARAERAEARQATLILTTLIAQTYIELQTKLVQKEILQDQLNERNVLFELALARNINGLDPVIPVLEKEQRLYEIEQALLELEKGILLDRHMLCTLVGLGPDSDIVPQPLSAFFKRPISIPSDLSSDLLARRPDLTAQIWRLEAAAKDIGAAKADFYPRVNLMAFAGLESLSFNKLFNFGSREGALAPAFHLPIFTGGRLDANLKNKVALFNEQTYRYNQLLLNAAREVADQIAILTATFNTLKYQIATVENVEEQLEVQYFRYKHGINTFLHVLGQEDATFAERYQLYGYQRDYLLAVLKMIKALGGGYRADSPLPYQEKIR